MSDRLTRRRQDGRAPAGEFFTLRFRADNPGTWIFHCSFPDHQANAGKSGFQGAPVGMTRIIQVGDRSTVPPQYFAPPS